HVCRKIWCGRSRRFSTRRRRPARNRAGAANMPRAVSARKGDRSRAPMAVKAGGKKTTGRGEKPPKPNGSSRTAAAKAPAKARAPIADRRASERTVQAGRTIATPEAGAGASRGKYVYCIIESGDPLRFGPIGIGADPSDVYTVHYHNLAAVVSDAPLEVLDSTRENVLAHERVNETVMREHTVIPMSFGTIFKTRDDIVELLRSAAEAFGDVLNKMHNKLEFGLK